MDKVKRNKKIKIEFQLKSIEILDVNLIFPGSIPLDHASYHYNINLQHRINEEKNFIFVDTAIEILHQDKKTKHGFIKATCVYFVENLLDYKSKSGAVPFDLPVEFITTLNSISISTTRGIMFSQFKGTFLHNAVLPIIDPKGFTVNK